MYVSMFVRNCICMFFYQYVCIHVSKYTAFLFFVKGCSLCLYVSMFVLIRIILYLDKLFCFVYTFKKEVGVKKFIFIFILCFSYVVSGSNSIFEVSFNFDVNGKQRWDVKGFLLGEHVDSEMENDVENWLTPSLQFGVPATKNLILGIGAKYQLPRKLNGLDGFFSFIPIYFFAKGIFSDSEYFCPYIIGQLGYNHFVGDSDYKGVAILTGKYYYGLGLGLILLSHLQFGVLYSVNAGSYHLDYTDINLNANIVYSKISFLFGFTQ